MRESENEHARFRTEGVRRAPDSKIYRVRMFASLLALFARNRRHGRSSLRYAVPRVEHVRGSAAGM